VLQLGKLLSSINAHIDFNFAYIGDDFTEEPKELFDPEFMKKLFNYVGQPLFSGEFLFKYYLNLLLICLHLYLSCLIKRFDPDKNRRDVI
jgi:hypothetical protein